MGFTLGVTSNSGAPCRAPESELIIALGSQSNGQIISPSKMSAEGVAEIVLRNYATLPEIRSTVPLGRPYFPYDSRHFVSGYYQPVPPGQKHAF
jgi:hypothetical protein